MAKPSMDEIDDFMATRSSRSKTDFGGVGAVEAQPKTKREPVEIYKKTGVQMRPEAHTQLKKLALELGMKDRECLAAALNLLFIKHGKGPVA